MILYLKDPKNSTKKTLRCHKHTQQSVGIQNQYTKISCISIHNEQSEKKIRKTIPFTIASKIQIPRSKFNQGNKNLYNENSKTLKK
jgi:hypothetical protein